MMGDSSMDGVRTVEVHPLVLLGGVDTHAVLLRAGLTSGLAFHPVGVGEGLATGVDEGSFSVEIVGSNPVGSQTSSHSIS